MAWKKEPLGGEEWLRLHRARLLEDIRSVEAVQSARILWSAERHVWRIELETLSGSMMSGITAFLPIAVPFDRTEAEGIIAMIDGLMTRGS